MAETFDPYFKWLGIRPEHQPPDHYRLLGLQRFESDTEVIENAADAKMSFLRSFRLGERMAVAERLLNELAEAKVCLLHADRKQAYDAKLGKDEADARPAAKTAAPLRAAVLVAEAVGPAGPVSAGHGTDTHERDHVKLPQGGWSNHRAQRRPQLSLVAMLAVVASGVMLAIVLLLPALRGTTERVARTEESATTTLKPMLPPTSSRPNNQEPPADADGDKSGAPPAANPSAPNPAAAETALQTDDQPVDQQPVEPVAIEPQPAVPQPVVREPTETESPVAVVALPNTTDLKPPPAETAAPREPRPDESVDPAVALPDLPPASVQRRAVPTPADQATIEADIREVYRTAQIQKIADRKQLTELLLDDAVATGAPNEQFVMLRMAAEMAATAGDVARASFAVGLMDERFQIDAVAMRLSLIEQAAKAPSSAEERRQALAAALPLLDAGLQANRFAEVEKVLAQVLTTTKRLKDNRLNDQLAELRKKAGTLARDHEKAKAAFAVLRTTPGDPQANLTVGSFWCFAKGDWDKGLPYLAQGADATLAGVAASEIKQPTAAADRAGLAEAWYKAARDAKDYAQQAMLRHAAGWYEEAIPELTGLLATAAQKNLDEIQNSLAQEEEEATAPKVRQSRIVAACDSEFELYLNGEPLLRGSSFSSRFGGRFGRGFSGRNRGDNNGNNNDGNVGNNRQSQEAERELKAGDVLIAKCTNQRSERGFACVIEFLDNKATIATAPGGAWKLFAPRDQGQWFNPNGIAAIDAAKPADGDKHLRIFEETRLRCLSIWGSNPSRAYFVLKLR